MPRTSTLVYLVTTSINLIRLLTCAFRSQDRLDLYRQPVWCHRRFRGPQVLLHHFRRALSNPRREVWTEGEQHRPNRRDLRRWPFRHLRYRHPRHVPARSPEGSSGRLLENRLLHRGLRLLRLLLRHPSSVLLHPNEVTSTDNHQSSKILHHLRCT